MKIINRLVLICLLLMLGGCSMFQMPTGGIQQLLENLQANIEPLIRLIIACAYVTGFMMIVSAMYKLRIYGETRTMMPTHAQLSGPLMQFLVGVCLLYFPTFINYSVYTFWNDPILEYSGGTDWTDTLKHAVFSIIQLFGYIAVLRGLIMMSKSAHQGAQPGLFSKGIVHFVGGVLAINIWGTIKTIGSSLGLIMS